MKKPLALVLVTLVLIVTACGIGYLITEQATCFEEIRDLAMSYIKEHYPNVCESINDIKWVSNKQHSLYSGVCYQYDSAEWSVSIGQQSFEPIIAIVASCKMNTSESYWVDYKSENLVHYNVVYAQLMFMWFGRMEGKTITSGDNFIVTSPENIRNFIVRFVENNYSDAAKYIDNELSWVETGKVTSPGSTIRYHCSYYAQRPGGDNWEVSVEYPFGPYEAPYTEWVSIGHYGENENIGMLFRLLEGDVSGLGHYVDIQSTWA
jgi:hypothetical protein